MKFDHSTESAPVEAFDLDSTYAFVHGIADELGLSDTHDIDAIVLQTANDIGLPDANETCDIDAIAHQTADEMGLGETTPHAEICETVHPPTTRVTASMLQEIHAVGRQRIQNEGGLPTLAWEYGVSYAALTQYITGNGSLTRRGEALIHESEHPPTTWVTASLLEEIHALGPQGIQDAGGLLGLARHYGVRYRRLCNYIYGDGSLTPLGEAKIRE